MNLTVAHDEPPSLDAQHFFDPLILILEPQLSPAEIKLNEMRVLAYLYY